MQAQANKETRQIQYADFIQTEYLQGTRKTLTYFAARGSVHQAILRLNCNENSLSIESSGLLIWQDFLTNPLRAFIGIISKEITTTLPYKFTGIAFRDSSRIRNARHLEPNAQNLRRLSNYIALILTLHDHDFRTPLILGQGDIHWLQITT
jgi:hypothetical protein